MVLTSVPPTWQMLLLLLAALVLSTAIGLERQLKNKSAGMRTHTLVGVGAALFMVISKYGFSDVVQEGLVTLDPSRVAAQIVSGIGFIGAGLVFVRRTTVHGLTTAASVWMTAAIGTACGAGLVWPAVFAAGCQLVIVRVWPSLFRRASRGTFDHVLVVRYVDGTGALRRILHVVGEHGFDLRGFTTRGGREAQASLSAEGSEARSTTGATAMTIRLVDVELEVHGRSEVSALVTQLGNVEDVVRVRVLDDDDL
jgi:putative Mg2+ transporter-C (MgtC) family protein